MRYETGLRRMDEARERVRGRGEDGSEDAWVGELGGRSGVVGSMPTGPVRVEEGRRVGRSEVGRAERRLDGDDAARRGASAA